MESETAKTTENLTGLILEGISGSGKTTIIKALLNSKRYLSRSSISSVILSEHNTQRILEKKQRESGLVKTDNLNLLNGHISYLSDLKSRLEEMVWCRKNQTKHIVPFLLERFHLTHVLHYKHIEWNDVKTIDSQLNSLNTKLCILTATSEELEERIFDARDTQWNNYIKRFGDTRDDILDHFLLEQERLLSLAKESTLRTLIINPSTRTLSDSVEKILDFWDID